MPSITEHRSSVGGAVVMTNSASSTPAIPYGRSGGGMVFVQGATGGAATISWYASTGAEDTKVPVVSGGSALTTTVEVGKAYPLPDALFAAPFIAGVVNAGTLTVTIAVKG